MMEKKNTLVVSIFFVAFVLCQNLLWDKPFAAVAIMSVLAASLLYILRSRFCVFLYILAMLLGPGSELFLVLFDLLDYYHLKDGSIPGIFGLLPLWLPLMWGVISVTTFILAESLIDYFVHTQLRASILNIVADIIFVMLIIGTIIIAIVGGDQFITSTLIMVLGFLLLKYLRDNLMYAAYFFIGAAIGLIAEATLLQLGAYLYVGPEFYNIPLWMGFSWGLVGVGIRHVNDVVRQIKDLRNNPAS